MRILIVAYSLELGGAERSAIRVGEGLASDGHEVTLGTVFSSRRGYSCPQEISHLALAPRTDSLTTRLTRANGPWARRFHSLRKVASVPLLMREIGCSIQGYGPDAVITFGAELGALVAFSFTSNGPPLVVSERIHPDPQVYRGSPLAGLRPLIYRLGAVCSVQDAVVEQWASDHWGVSAVVTPNHLDDNWFGQKSIDVRTQSYLLALGRDAPQKNLDLLLGAWARLGESVHAELKVVGVEEPSRLAHLADKLGCSSSVTIEPPSQDARKVLTGALVLLSTSNFEGFPNVILEALALGVPVVATRSCEVVTRAERAGALICVEVGDATGIVSAIERLISEPMLRSQLGENARRFAAQFRWSSVSSTWYEALERARAREGIRMSRAFSLYH